MMPPAGPSGCATRTRRCRAVDAMLAGVSPTAACRQRRREPRHRLPLARALPVRRLGGTARAPLHPEAPAAPPLPVRGGRDRAARERSGAGPLTLGALLGRPASTVGKVLRRLGGSRLRREPRPPVVRYERDRPGELLHIETDRNSVSGTSASASSATGSRAVRARAGSTSMSPSTTTRVWPTPRCSPRTAATTRSRSSSGRCAGSVDRASRSRR